MARLELDQYSKEVEAASPCGENLEYDPDFQEMERAAAGKPETQFSSAEPPEWNKVQELALRLLARTRDIRVAVQLAFSLAATDGFQGVEQGLALINELLEKFWECVYPQQNEGDEFPVKRMNSLASLNSYPEFLSLVRAIPLTDSRVMGIFDYHDIETAGEHADAADADGEGQRKTQVEAAFLDSDPQWMAQNLASVDLAIASVKSIQQLTIERVGAVNAPDLDGLQALLQDIGDLLKKQVDADGAENADDSADGPEGGIPGDAESEAEVKVANVTGGIGNRRDVVVAIDAICEYFDRHEPSSPVPLLLQRAKGLMSKSFLEIIEDIAPDGIKQAEGICKSEKS